MMPPGNKKHRTRPTVSPSNILYELMLYTEWNQESDVTRSVYKLHDHHSSLGYIWRPWEYFRKCDSLLDEVANLQGSLLGWHFAVGGVGTVLAVLQDTHLEIRTPRDDFSSIIGKASVARDNYPQWRQLCWSPDCSVLALASSNGAVCFYDLLGSNLFSIPSENVKDSQSWQPELSLAGMFFITARIKNQKWPYELILVDHGGNLRSYYISPSDGVLEFHRYSFSKAGVSSVCWDHCHNLLLVASTAQHSYLDLKTEAVGWGVSAYRLVNDHPYYRLAVPSPEDLARVDARGGILSWIRSLYTHPTFSVVFKMALSPDGRHLTCLHTCGQVSVWLLPSLRLHRVWGLKEQPTFDIQSENNKKKSRVNQLEDLLPVDVSWWADEKVMLARKNGAVSVCELSGLHNLLGETPEFVHGEPRLSPVSTHKGVLVLECQTSSNQEGEESSDEEESLLNKSTVLLQSTVYLITDMERFQPKRKRTKKQQRTYRLLGIKSTTPDELFSRKIDAGEFEEALHLAQVYDLDSDRVYQSQWRNSPVSEQTISAYLSKISKKRWVFEECAERVPDTLLAAKQLVEFGLKMTSLPALADLQAEGQDLNEEQFVCPPPECLSDEQKCLILTRRTLLRFSDRLYTYEQITNSSEESYDREVYDKFRRRPICLSALELAQNSDHRAVGLLLTYQTPEALPYWLTILSSFPETTSPASYKHLLPECSFDGEVFPWEQSPIRSRDWSEHEQFDVLEPEEDFSEYNMPLRDEPLTAAVLEDWYRNRIYELEQRSNMVDQPLQLVRLARERNISGLDSLFNELVTLDVLVYDVGMEDISLRDLEVMTPLQKSQALMGQPNENDFVEKMRHRLVPYLQRCEKLRAVPRRELLTQYLSSISATDLTCPLKLFEYCLLEPCNALVQSTEELMQLALVTVYTHTGTDQLDKAETILKSLSILPPGSSCTELCKRMSAVEEELRVAVILKQRAHPLSLSYLHHHRDSVETAKALFMDLCIATGNRVPSAVEAEWNQLLQDLLLLQSLVFTCVPDKLCYEVHTAAVLGSGSTAVIRTAVRSLCCHSEEEQRKPLSLLQSVSLVLSAAQQYFDSASTLTDHNISLARTCLNLITEEHRELQEEKDLIVALQLLNDFKISLLPMQVRLCADRMKLVDSCLSSRRSAYKDYHKLLSLAHKLRICGSDSRQREGIILVKAANIAFEAQDYRHCAEVCQQLAERRHTTGWQPAQRLGQCEHFSEINTRERLVAFALVHCPDDKLQDLLETRCELEYKRLRVFIQEQASSADTLSEDEDFVDAATSPQSPSREFLPQLSSTIQNTSKLITQLTHSGFWKEKLLNIESKKDTRQKGESVMTEQGFHEFYHSLHSHCHDSILSAQYCGETLDWRQYNLMQALLQVSLLQQEKLSHQLVRDNDSVLVKFASLVLPEDSSVGLVALLALAEPEAGDQCFSCLPLTLVTLQLAVYLCALLQVLQRHPEAFSWSPDQVLCRAEAVKPLSQLLEKALTQLKNVEQSKQMEQLNCGVNVRRFAWDLQYKTDSILGLAMCEDWEKLRAALDLGAEHGVAGWEIVFCHIRSLLLSNSPQLTHRLTDNRLVQLLAEQADLVIKRLEENVLATLSGVNHNQLINYYTVLQTVAGDTVVQGLLPRDHIKLIKKVKATSVEIDYTRIVLRPDEVLEALRPALRKDTVASVTKLLKELLKALPSIQAHISVSKLYTEWAVTQFKVECFSSTCRSPIEQFSTMHTYFQKMCGDDLLCFVKKAIFCHQSVIQLDPDTRLSMINMVLRHGYQQHDANDDPSLKKIQQLKEYLHQLWELENPSLKSLKNYLIRLDEACGDSDAVSTIIQTALLDASVPSHVLLKITKVMNKKMMSAYVTDLLHSLPPQPQMLTTVLQRVEDCLAQGEKGDSWSILIGPITERSELPANVRKQAAQITQKLGSNYNEELEALRLRTEAVLRTSVSLTQVCDQNCRYLLYKELLTQAETWDSLHTLSLLLTSWPDVDTSWYLELIETMAEVPNSESFPVLQKILRKNQFSEEEMLHLVSRLEGCDDLFTINVCILSDFKTLHLKAVELLSKLPCEFILPRDLVGRLVERELLVKLLKTEVFEQVLSTVPELGVELCGQAVSQLQSAGLLNEADKLQRIVTRAS